MSKAILSVLKFDILQAAGSSQLCAGQDSGCEAAIHAVRELFNCPDTKAIFSSLMLPMLLILWQGTQPF